MRAVRHFWWRRIRRYAYEICDRCGRPSSGGVGYVGRDHDGVMPTTCWFAVSDLWNFVMGGPGTMDDPGGTLCCRCFTAECEAQGIALTWVAGRLGEIEEQVS